MMGILKPHLVGYTNVLFVIVSMMKELLNLKGFLMTNLADFVNECEENLSKIKTFIDIKNELNIDISDFDSGVLHGKREALEKIVKYLNQQD